MPSVLESLCSERILIVPVWSDSGTGQVNVMKTDCREWLGGLLRSYYRGAA